MDYVFRRLPLDHLRYDQRAELGILSAAEVAGDVPASPSDDPDPEEVAQSTAVEQPHYPERAVVTPRVQPHPTAGQPVPAGLAPHSSMEMIETQQGRTAAPHLRQQDASRRQLLRLRRLRLHQRLQLQRAGTPARR